MFIVILFIFLGILSGYLLRKKTVDADKTKTEGMTKTDGKTKLDRVARWQGRIVTWLIWVLLFLLGVEVGNNDRVISALPTLGVEALVLSVAATLGSCLLAWGLWKMVRKKEEKMRMESKDNYLFDSNAKRGGVER